MQNIIYSIMGKGMSINAGILALVSPPRTCCFFRMQNITDSTRPVDRIFRQFKSIHLCATSVKRRGSSPTYAKLNHLLGPTSRESGPFANPSSHRSRHPIGCHTARLQKTLSDSQSTEHRDTCKTINRYR